ncbi:MAG: cadherin repeat domain-containing protein, partial [Cyclobacteriaceae bacterium]
MAFQMSYASYVYAQTPPTITSPNTADAAENQTFVIDVQAFDAEGDTEGGGGLTYSLNLTTGIDDALFAIDINTGILTFLAAPDFEAPGDVGGDNIYNVEVTVTDSEAIPLTGVQNLVVTVTDVNEPPTITSASSVSVAENLTFAINVQATDPEGETEGGGGLTYSFTNVAGGGVDNG